MNPAARRRIGPLLLCAGLAMSCSGSAQAQGQALAATEPVSVTAVAAAADSGRPAPLAGTRLAGQGLLRFWGLEVYQASLWVGPAFRPESFASQPFALELEYRRAFKAGAIAERSIQEMRRLGSFSDSQAQRWQRALQAALPDVRPGDRIVGLHRPGLGARFEQGGRLLGEVADPEFARLFFAIWLSPGTSEPTLREALLAGVGPG